MDGSDIPTNLTGLYQYIIGTLAFVVTTLVGVNVWQYKDAVNINKARLTERDVLNKALTDANTVLRDLSDTAKRRNEVTEQLGGLLNQISIAMTLLTERLELQHNHSNKDLEKAIEMVEAMAESLRAVTMELRNGFADVKRDQRA